MIREGSISVTVPSAENDLLYAAFIESKTVDLFNGGKAEGRAWVRGHSYHIADAVAVYEIRGVEK